MSLIKCPECGKDVSNLAEKCIHCGYPLQRPLKYKSYKAMKKEKEERKKEMEKKEMEKKEKLRSIVRCPYCGSADVKKIFFLGGYAQKQWHCRDCRSNF